ncbi:PEP-CTERM sorting domain-containing protein [Paludisphaera soli]|uniref:PEP-CTERM sorting domain-containing protein n=1 Tax=Paludisphaera soli TaxID=2712865 RepID=UPI0013EDE782|nr:PEP-CTERM sorting domain-containing protein [Paludisphaera soli]
MLSASGGDSGNALAANAGGGSGGGLLIHAPTIETSAFSTIKAEGGSYFSGGGRILVLTETATIIQRGRTISTGPGGGANNQQPGVVEFGYLGGPASVPEPSSLALALLGGLGAAALARRARS